MIKWSAKPPVPPLLLSCALFLLSVSLGSCSFATSSTTRPTLFGARLNPEFEHLVPVLLLLTRKDKGVVAAFAMQRDIKVGEVGTEVAEFLLPRLCSEGMPRRKARMTRPLQLTRLGLAHGPSFGFCPPRARVALAQHSFNRKQRRVFDHTAILLATGALYLVVFHILQCNR